MNSNQLVKKVSQLELTGDGGVVVDWTHLSATRSYSWEKGVWGFSWNMTFSLCKNQSSVRYCHDLGSWLWDVRAMIGASDSSSIHARTPHLGRAHCKYLPNILLLTSISTYLLPDKLILIIVFNLNLNRVTNDFWASDFHTISNPLSRILTPFWNNSLNKIQRH